MRPWLVSLWILAACGGADDALAVDAAAVADAAPDAAPDAADGCHTQPVITEVTPAAGAEVTVAGDVGSTLGIFDPTFVYPSGAPGGAMAYSSVPDQHSIRTRIAVSPDAGATWTYVAQPNAPIAVTLTSTSTAECPSGTCTGFLIDEVSTLVLDPFDPAPARRWKLLTHRYLAEADNRLHYAIGTIALYTASAPEGPWSAGQPLIGWASSSPHSTAGVATNVSTIPALADCLALTEPSAVVRADALDLALGCVYLDAGAPAIRVVLLRSTDHGATFQYVTTLLDRADATCVGGAARTRYNAAHLFVSGGAEYLIASAGGDDGGYAGCDVFAIDDPVAGGVRRDAGGAALAIRRLTVPGRFNGACAAAEGVTGYVLSVLHADAPPRVFRIVRSGVAAP